MILHQSSPRFGKKLTLHLPKQRRCTQKMISSKNKNAIDPKQKWRYVLRHGSGGSSKHILEIGKDSKKILVQYLPSSYVISKNITDPAKHFLGCNNVVRDYTNIGEKGKMVMAGERYDDFRCCTDFYVPKGGKLQRHT